MRLGILFNIEWYDTKGNAQNTGNYLQVAQTSYNSGDGAYDIYASYSRATGLVATNLLHFMYGVYYNRDMINDYQLTDPTEYVQNGTWTQDKMIEMTQGLYADLNNNGKADPNDRYGMTSVYWHLDALYTGAGLRLVEPNDDKTLVVSRDFVGEMKTGASFLPPSRSQFVYNCPIDKHTLVCYNVAIIKQRR